MTFGKQFRFSVFIGLCWFGCGDGVCDSGSCVLGAVGRFGESSPPQSVCGFLYTWLLYLLSLVYMNWHSMLLDSPPRKSVEKSQKVSILDGLVRMLVYTVGCRPVHYGFFGGENCRQTKNPNLPAPAEICSALTQSCSSRRNLSGPDKIVRPQKIFVLCKGSKIYLITKIIR